MKTTKECTQHPLLNPDSPHYEVTGDEAIVLMERMYTNTELSAWAKISAMKYRLRIGKKDDPNKELIKIATYEDYFNYLETQPLSSIDEAIVRTLRNKSSDTRIMDYRKIRHICDERIRQLELEEQLC